MVHEEEISSCILHFILHRRVEKCLPLNGKYQGPAISDKDKENRSNFQRECLKSLTLNEDGLRVESHKQHEITAVEKVDCQTR